MKPSAVLHFNSIGDEVWPQICKGKLLAAFATSLVSTIPICASCASFSSITFTSAPELTSAAMLIPFKEQLILGEFDFETLFQL